MSLAVFAQIFVIKRKGEYHAKLADFGRACCQGGLCRDLTSCNDSDDPLQEQLPEPTAKKHDWGREERYGNYSNTFVASYQCSRTLYVVVQVHLSGALCALPSRLSNRALGLGKMCES